jgi:hypothetical protein
MLIVTRSAFVVYLIHAKRKLDTEDLSFPLFSPSPPLSFSLSRFLDSVQRQETTVSGNDEIRRKQRTFSKRNDDNMQ